MVFDFQLLRERQSGQFLRRQFLFQQQRGRSDFFHSLATFGRFFQFSFDGGALGFFQFAQHISGQFRIVGDDFHGIFLIWFVASACSGCIRWRRDLIAVWIRKPTLVTVRFVMALISW